MVGPISAKRSPHARPLCCHPLEQRHDVFYQRLIARGKNIKVALTACMRKLLITLNAMVKNNEPYHPKFRKSVLDFQYSLQRAFSYSSSQPRARSTAFPTAIEFFAFLGSLQAGNGGPLSLSAITVWSFQNPVARSRKIRRLPARLFR